MPAPFSFRANKAVIAALEHTHAVRKIACPCVILRFLFSTAFPLSFLLLAAYAFRYKYFFTNRCGTPTQAPQGPVNTNSERGPLSRPSTKEPILLCGRQEQWKLPSSRGWGGVEEKVVVQAMVLPAMWACWPVSLKTVPS